MSMNKFEIVTNGGDKMAVNDNVEISSTSSDHLNGQVGVIKGIVSGRHGTEVQVLLESGIETWIDAEEVITF
ncbi:hypothetical protein ACSE5K_10205 [Bacillus velezensis]|uniref:hypothetical protein n=1 Tax=Bacillus TaxID=1386 RepID=UPI0004589110|nr:MULTISPECIES: hypothetical protein [Bacillus]AIW37817.1 hypothetical protein KS07_10100 [Bacillus subtilis]AHZ16295.1 hypothetical protein V529_22690 [Bacillus velezensis SQR9]AKF76279.1 hypothetical protein AAV30_08940 [Bacillus velezensis]AKF76319.1 hypothetical protein AAV30_09200 [Bacillus velezensis]AWD15483.1 hypothetical protein B9C53_19255 [Bacillus velezensis]